MNSTILGAIVSSICFFSFFLLFIFYKPLNKLRFSWAVFNLLVSLWSAGLFLSYISSGETALFFGRLLNFFASFIPISFIYYSLVFVSKDYKYRYVTRILFLINIVYFILCITNIDLFIPAVNKDMGYENWAVAGPLYFFFPIQFFVYVMYGFYLLIQDLKISSIIKKQQIYIIMLGTGIGFIGGFITFLPVLKIPVNPSLGSWGVALYSVIVSYGIFKYELMDIRVVIRKGLVYSILLATLTVFYLLSILLVENILQTSFRYSSKPISLGVMFILGLAFVPIRDKIQNFIDLLFFKKTNLELEYENKKLLDHVSRTEHMKSVAELAAGMAHEIKNPLQSIKTFFEYLPERKNDHEFLDKFAKFAHEDLDRINDLIKQLLDYSKPSDPIKEEINLSDLIISTKDLLANDCLKKGVKINHNLPDKLLANIDKKQIRQVILNLLMNSIDSINNNKGEIGIYSNVTKNYVEIAFKDNGCGMTEEELNLIYDPFFTKKADGNGLGMAIVKSIIEKHNGQINVYSSSNKGTNIIIRLPRN